MGQQRCNGMATVTPWHASSGDSMVRQQQGPRHDTMAQQWWQQHGNSNCDDGGSSMVTATSAAAITMAAGGIVITTRQTVPALTYAHLPGMPGVQALILL